MRLIARGVVVEHDEPRTWQGRDGQPRTTHAFFLRPQGDSGRYGADRVEVDLSNVPPLGSVVEAEVLVRARENRRDASKPFLSVYATGVHVVEAPALASA